MRRKILFIMLMIVTIKGSAQTELEKVLSQIERNNKSLISEKQFWEAEKLSYRTGLNPENPLVEYEHLPGTPKVPERKRIFR
ncbi:MAG: hypothetical protein HWD62_14635 [Cyclobacteriaceae bacterium]|nr:MAG: hypothetical protein HWD62_14635 [Cyclobacteriaceae bacterium]